MKHALVGLLMFCCTTVFAAEDVYECYAGQNAFLEGGPLAGVLMQIGNAKIPADGKLYEFKADKIKKGFIYIYITKYSSSNNVVARAVFVPADKRLVKAPDLKALVPFFEFDEIEAISEIGKNASLRAGYDNLITVPGSETQNGKDIKLRRSTYLNCYFSQSPPGDGIEF